jgi:hypothetical protein
MLDNIDELIELNLKLLYDSPNKYMWRIDFRNEKRQKIQDSLRFAKILDKKGLIDLEPSKMYRCELSEFGNKIVISGGWIKHLEMEREDRIKRTNKTLTIIAENYIGGNNYGTQSSKSFSKSPIRNNTTANPKADVKANSIMLKFWKLISENKLVSSLLVVIILWVNKRYFNINFKNCFRLKNIADTKPKYKQKNRMHDSYNGFEQLA